VGTAARADETAGEDGQGEREALVGVTVALAGDTMLGRGVGEHIATVGTNGLFSDDVREVFASADLRLLNLECCVSARGRPWDAPGKPFHFRAPPAAVDALTDLGVDCVTLANNHALDFGYDALADTRDHLSRAGIEAVGAGVDRGQAQTPVVLEAGGMRIAVLGVTDHPADFAATERRPGVAYAHLCAGVPDWLTGRIGALADAGDVVLVMPHWGPNMTTEPLPYVRAAARALVDAGAALVAGHSAHVFHGVAGRILYDLGDLIDDYAVNDLLRNDLGLLFLVTVEAGGPVRLTGVPLRLGSFGTRLATGAEHAWIRERFTAACAALGTAVKEEDGRLTVEEEPRCDIGPDGRRTG
jgi:poly-gamma-glutamate synthesis protein (capsule biosynthesis protein)